MRLAVLVVIAVGVTLLMVRWSAHPVPGRSVEQDQALRALLARHGGRELADDRHPDAVLVVARDATGAPRAALQFLSWGRGGLSLDVMLRDPPADNGVVEHAVVRLFEWCRDHAITVLSLNFAVARWVFARGDRVGAGPVLRLWRAVSRVGARFWQLESLYRANAKYQPSWVPRFLAYPSARDLPAVLGAVARAEGFLARPGKPAAAIPDLGP